VIKRVVYSDIGWKQQFAWRTCRSVSLRLLGNSVWWWIHWRSSKSCLSLSRSRISVRFGLFSIS